MALPKLPIPSLTQTLDSYKHATAAITTEEEKKRVNNCVDQLLKTDGPTIQQYLERRRSQHDNWAYDWWLNDMYLNNPVPLPINSNPGMIFPLKSFKNDADFLKYTALFIEETFRYKHRIDNNLLPQDKAASRERGQPLCMLQYKRIFSSYRQSGVEKDILHEFPQDGDSHFIVALRGQFFVINYRRKGTAISLQDLYGQLRAIYSSACGTKREKVGLLTTTNRRRWGTLLEKLLEDETNCENFNAIAKSSFIVCLDEDHSDLEASSRMKQMLHGGGTKMNSVNRWFDKTIQLIFSRNGSCGLCYEHSPAEGIVVVQMIEETLRICDERMDEKLVCDLDLNNGTPKKLEWTITPEIEQAIEEIAGDLDRATEDLDLLVYAYPEYGKEFVKKYTMSPDVFIQVVLQLAYFRIHRHLVATYESAATRRFQKGRVDCIRAATPEALEWAVAMTTNGVSNADKLARFQAAVDVQTKIMVENILGNGIDIHLLGMREAAKELGIKLPLIEDEVYKRANHFALSTSQISTTLETVMGYGPVVPDGYGVSYNIKKNSFVFCISSFLSSEKTGSLQFSKVLETCLSQTKNLLENSFT